jgi:hypothetical protein
MFKITFSNGDSPVSFLEYEECIRFLERKYPDLELGHDGDLSDKGDRTLVWENEQDSINDAGANAVASITNDTKTVCDLY